MEVGFIREVKHPTWLANPVMVPKKNDTWHLCVNYKDISKVFPKEPYPLSCIDQIIDATMGHELFSFLDAYSGSHRIRMKVANHEATYFIMLYGRYSLRRRPGSVWLLDLSDGRW